MEWQPFIFLYHERGTVRACTAYSKMTLRSKFLAVFIGLLLLKLLNLLEDYRHSGALPKHQDFQTEEQKVKGVGDRGQVPYRCAVQNGVANSTHKKGSY